jgi:hypothetical protein
VSILLGKECLTIAKHHPTSRKRGEEDETEGSSSDYDAMFGLEPSLRYLFIVKNNVEGKK